MKVPKKPAPGDEGDFVQDKALHDLAQAARSVEEARNQERQTLARDLHDRVVQPLVALLTALDVLPQHVSSQRLPSVDPLPDWMLTPKELAREALGALRDVVAGLHTHPYATQGLPDALRAYLAPLFQDHGVHVIVESRDWPDHLPPEWTFHLYLAAREAVINADKHGHATEIRVLLQAEAERLHLVVSDNGGGFHQLDDADPNTDLSGNGLGIANMRDRARLLGGELTIRSTPGDGIQVSITAPRPSQNGDSSDSPSAMSPS